MRSEISILGMLALLFWSVPWPSFGSDAHPNLKGGNEPFRVPLQSYGGFSLSEEDVHIEWSPTGQRLCLWWNHGSITRRVPSQWMVLGTNGVLISSWTNPFPNAQDALAEFPTLAMWFKWRQYLTNATACAYDEKTRSLFRASPPTLDLSLMTRMERVALHPTNRVVWAREFKSVGRVELMRFLSEEGGERLFLGFSDTGAKFVDPATGEVTASFTYGHIETDKEALKRKRKFKLSYPGIDVSSKFSAWMLGFDGNQRRVAAGGFFDQRMRVVSLVEPFPVLFEANTDKSPAIPPGGLWQVYWLDFVAAGKYLVVEYFFSRPRPHLALRPTEIFETQRWHRVWQVDDLRVHSVTVSPDGRTLVLIRDNVLEIGPFVPREIDSGIAPQPRK